MTFANSITNLQANVMPAQYGGSLMPAITNVPMQVGGMDLMSALASTHIQSDGFNPMPTDTINSIFPNYGQMGGNFQMIPYLTASQTPFPFINQGMSMFNMPQMNFQNLFAQYWQFNNANNNAPDDSDKKTEKKEKQSDDGTVKTDAETLAALKKLGYNEEKGRKLAKVAKEHCAGRSYGKCATWVKQDIEKAGLGKYKSGHGKDIDNAYADNSNFKVVDATNLNCKKLPPGCIQVFEAGEAGYHRIYGHTQIIGEDGKGYSDCAIKNIKQCKQILIPV